MSETMTFEFSHGKAEDVFEVDVQVDAIPDGIDSYFKAVRTAVGSARMEGAATLVDRAAFHSNTSYDAEVKRVAGQIRVEGYRVTGETQRYSVEGTYSDGGGTWSDWVDGVNAADAEFSGKWAMAENQGAEPGDFAEFLRTMERIEIEICSPEPVTKDEYKATLKALVEEAIASGHSGTALDEAVERLRSDGYEIETSSGMRP